MKPERYSDLQASELGQQAKRAMKPERYAQRLESERKSDAIDYTQALAAG
jgi:hypothetical protein